MNPFETKEREPVGEMRTRQAVGARGAGGDEASALAGDEAGRGPPRDLKREHREMIDHLRALEKARKLHEQEEIDIPMPMIGAIAMPMTPPPMGKIAVPKKP